MVVAPISDGDVDRSATLHSYDILDTPPEPGYDDLAALAMQVCNVSCATITFVDGDRQFIKAEAGFDGDTSGRTHVLRSCAILSTETLVIEDTLLDPRFNRNPLGMGRPQVRFYAGAPILAPEGHVLGAVCVFDAGPHRLSSAQVAGLEAIARQVQRLLEHRKAMSRVAALPAAGDAERHLGELAAIVESSDDVILSKDLNGIVTSWNPAAARLFGYSAEEMVGQSILKLIPEELHSDEALIIGRVRSGKRIEHFETVRLTKDGRRLSVSLTISPVKDDQGRVIGASKILRDISDRKRIEDSLLQSEKIAAAGRMASTIAHEVNNPLEAVTNLLYLLRPLITDTAGIEYLATAETEIARVSHIAKRTLGFYREHTAATATSLSELVQDTMKIYEPRCDINGITIERSFASKRTLVLRRGEMMQVLSNLIANSMYAMPTGGTLTVRVEDAYGPEEGVVVTVRDTGVGIAQKDLPRVFEAFYTTRGEIGTGIGLFIARQFVEGHGGRMELQSSQGAKDHGTSVRIHLPLKTLYDVAGVQ